MSRDTDCIAFLQWALPKLRLRWPGFRKVRRQVCKRISRRVVSLGLSDLAAYSAYLEASTSEWNILDSLCYISISRFYRDRSVFDRLSAEVWPALSMECLKRGRKKLRCWSIGCASGEEPYTLNLIWQFELKKRFPLLDCQIVATDYNAQLLKRAKYACYPASSLRDLPPEWLQPAFDGSDFGYELQDSFRNGVQFLQQDIRQAHPDGSFDLILCRNVVLTYFEEDYQKEIMAEIIGQLRPLGVWIMGIHEQLPEKITRLKPWFPELGIFRRSD